MILPCTHSPAAVRKRLLQRRRALLLASFLLACFAVFSVRLAVFSLASAFNQNINAWDLSKVTTTSESECFLVPLCH